MLDSAWPKPRGGRTYEIVTAIYGRLFALLALVALSPLWLAIAVAIKLTSAGPVLFRTKAAGFDSRPGREEAGVCIHTPSDSYGPAEDAQLAVNHVLTALIRMKRAERMEAVCDRS